MISGNNMLSKIKSLSKKRNFIHYSFEFGVILKGIDGVLEVLGGFLLLLINPTRLNKIVLLLTQHELSEDPNDIFMNLLLRSSHKFSISSQYFGVFYLLSHGIVKLILVCLLLKKRLWAYPLTIAFLILFIIYQIYRYSKIHSSWLIVLTIFDVVMIYLTWVEYQRIQKELKHNL
jgi:uncharacterized membrane protein